MFLFEKVVYSDIVNIQHMKINEGVIPTLVGASGSVFSGCTKNRRVIIHDFSLENTGGRLF